MKIKQMRTDMQALLFLLPFLVIYLVFTIWPMLKGIEMSLYKWTLIKKMKYIGWDNYSRMFHDDQFWASLWHSTLFVILTTPTMLVLAIVLALMANRKSRLQKFYRTTFFLPSILSVAVASFLGIFMFQPYTGFINSTLHLMGLLPEGTEIFWLTETNLSWIVLTVTTLWWTVGVNFILYLSAMQDIPAEMFEAARLDGANDRQMFWEITLPILKPITKTILLLQVIASFKVFIQIYLITKGGPLDTTKPAIQYIYEAGFRKNDLGYAATLSYMMFAIILILSLVQYRINTRKGEI